MSKLKKLTIVYLARIGIVTFLITLSAFLIDLTNYYKISIFEAIQRIIFDNIYTIIYFLMIWILNYLCYEIFKIIYDSFKENYFKEFLSKSNIIIMVGFVISILIILVIKIDNLFKINFILLLLLMFGHILQALIQKKK